MAHPDRADVGTGQLVIPYETAKSLGGESALSSADIGELDESTMRVFDLMRDGLWHTPEDIRRAAGKDGVPASVGLRRMRSLRNVFKIEKKRLRGRTWLY